MTVMISLLEKFQRFGELVDAGDASKKECEAFFATLSCMRQLVHANFSSKGLAVVSLEEKIAEKDRRIQELLETNNQYLERARKAEAAIAEAKALIREKP